MKISQPSIYWHDYETFGADPMRDRPAQFAGIRTDENLNIIGDPLVIYCQQSPDYLPAPQACLVTGITPQIANQKGENEFEFMRQINAEFSKPQTCVAGYNSIRFDDEVTRHSLYRNLFDPYAREWQNRNSRWDIIDMMRLTHAVRPEGIEWPKNENGTTSFRLELLTAANGIGHEAAHDALNDVTATIEMAKLVREKQPRLYDYVFQNRSKKRVAELLDLKAQSPVLHVSSRYPAELGCIALVIPLCKHPTNPNGVIVYDLRQDPAGWVDLGSDEIRERIYTRKDDLAPGLERIALKTIHINRCPIVVTPKVMESDRAKHWQIDYERCKQHREQLLNVAGLETKVAQVFSESGFGQPDDPDLMLYSGPFLSNEDRFRLDQIRNSDPYDIVNQDMRFDDKRLKEMVFRFRARNYPTTLSHQDELAWWDFCRQRLTEPVDGFRTFDIFADELQTALDENSHKPEKIRILEAVADYANRLAQVLQR